MTSSALADTEETFSWEVMHGLKDPSISKVGSTLTRHPRLKQEHLDRMIRAIGGTSR